MSPPTQAEQDAALAALSGTVTEAKPVTGLDRAMLRLRLVAEAKNRGVSWTVIGAAMGVSGKEAKRLMKRLAARTQHDLLAARNREAPQCPEPSPAAGTVPVSGAAAAGAGRAPRQDGPRATWGRNGPDTRKKQHHIRRRGRA